MTYGTADEVTVMPTLRWFRRTVLSNIVVVVVVALFVFSSVPAAVSAQTDDEEEPNDSFVEALQIADGSVVVGTVSDDSDADVYRLDLEVGQQFFVELWEVDGGDNLTLAAYDSAGTKLAEAGSDASGFGSIFGVAPESESYYFAVVPFSVSTATDYELTAYVVTNPPATGQDVADLEPNDVASFATPLRGGTASGTVAHPMDSDVYAVRLAAGERLDVELDATDAADIDLYIDGQQGEFLAESAGPASSERVSFVAPATDVYYVVVWPTNVTEATSYTLTTDRTRPSTGTMGGQFETARVLEPGRYSSSASDSTDIDIYGVELRTGQQLQVDLAAESGDVDVYLYGPDLTLLDWSALPADAERVGTTADRPGVYYVLIVPIGIEAETRYDFDVTVADRAATTD